MDKIAVIYWSGTGNTEAMANTIAEGIKAAGNEADVMDVSAAAGIQLADYAKVAFGCPSMGDEMLEESEFDPYFTDIESSLGGKKVALFGSYGWGDGQWMRDWVKRTEAAGANLMDEGLIMQDAPDEAACMEYGKKFAAY
jgi:flavodoxin short chain